MAFKSLVEVQCGQGNPLVSLSHHLTKDKIHKESKIIHPKSLWDENDSSGMGITNCSSEHLAEEYFRQAGDVALPAPQSFRMGKLMMETQRIELEPPVIDSTITGITSEAIMWIHEYQASKADSKKCDFSENFETSEYSTGEVEAKSLGNQFIDNNELYENGSNELRQSFSNTDCELAKTANEVLITVDDPKFKTTEFMKYMRTLIGGSNDIDLKDWQSEFLSSNSPYEINSWSPVLTNEKVTDPESWKMEFLNATSNAKLQGVPKPERWAQELSNTELNGPINDVIVDSESMSVEEKEEFWKKLQEEWTDVANQEDGKALSDFMADYGDPFKEYVFRENDSLKDHPDPLSEGKKCLELGDIPSAVLFFETAVIQNPNCSEAWILLGNTHAVNEQDSSAIAALKRGLELDPSFLNGWLSLATSYTNESYQIHACRALEEWIRNNKEYDHLLKRKNDYSQPKIIVSSLASREYLDEIQDLYLRAANIRPNNQIDSDVQCGLGILFNLTGDFEKAIDCLHLALRVKPEDPQFWNKLGATLANSSRPAEAIDAYRNALEISPGFIRCRYNLGIACISLGAHREAVEHFIETLNMQEKSQENDSSGFCLAASDNIWTTLRVCLRSIDLSHLVHLVDNRDLVKLNQEFKNLCRDD